MSFLLARYWARPRQTCTGAAIRCPEVLVRDLAHNSLEVSDTVTDGNCGVHGFGSSLADGGKYNKILCIDVCIQRIQGDDEHKHRGDARILAEAVR